MKTGIAFALLMAVTLSSFAATERVVVIDGNDLTTGQLESLLVDAGVVGGQQSWKMPATSLVVLGAGGQIESINLLDKLDGMAASAGGRVHLVPGAEDIKMKRSATNASDWLGSQPYILQIGDTIYTTGGVSRRASSYDAAGLNTRVDYEHERYPELVSKLATMGVDLSEITLADAISKYGKKRRYRDIASVLDEIDDMLSTNEDTPWEYRGTAACHPFSESFNTERFLKKTNASHIVVQSIDSRGTNSRMEGMVTTIDSSDPAADGAVLVVDSNGVRTRSSQLPAEEERSISTILSGMSDSELERFFTRGRIVRTKDIGTGITKPLRVTQSLDGITQDSVFKYVDTNKGLESGTYISRVADTSDRFVYEVAAYRLDRLLGLQLVPTAVVTNVESKRGVLQDWVTNAINERDRLEDNISFDSYCKKIEQYRIRVIFDVLIHNDDRNLTNILWNKDNFQLWLIDHTRAFRSSDERPEQYKKTPIYLSDLTRRKLASLNKNGLTRELGSYLHPRQIDALLARRDLILEEANSSEPGDDE